MYPTIGASIITYTILGVPHYNNGIKAIKAPILHTGAWRGSAHRRSALLSWDSLQVSSRFLWQECREFRVEALSHSPYILEVHG